MSKHTWTDYSKCRAIDALTQVVFAHRRVIKLIECMTLSDMDKYAESLGLLITGENSASINPKRFGHKNVRAVLAKMQEKDRWIKLKYLYAYIFSEILKVIIIFLIGMAMGRIIYVS